MVKVFYKKKTKLNLQKDSNKFMRTNKIINLLLVL